MFFCCNVCADIFENMVGEIKRRTGWEKIDYVELHGNYGSGRNCVAINDGKEFSYYYDGKEFSYYFRTYSDGRMMKFEEKRSESSDSVP